ncbi:MAG TPA: hypothetical protein VES40_07325 [Ilumatobacteraceae bacterium]|nr:hypothetical protein [Ilumatobacteraceae bacterium]
MKNSHIDGTDHNEGPAFSIECDTCVATGSTACAECIVTHLLANDDGPIDLVTVRVDAPVSGTDRAVALFQRAGLLDDPAEFVSLVEFEQGFVARVGA